MGLILGSLANYAESFHGLEGDCKVGSHGGLPSSSGKETLSTGGPYQKIKFLTNLITYFKETFTEGDMTPSIIK